MADQASDKATDEAKRKFREALDKKKQNEQDRPAHLDAESQVHGTHGKAGGKRQFQRRKSG